MNTLNKLNTSINIKIKNVLNKPLFYFSTATLMGCSQGVTIHPVIDGKKDKNASMERREERTKRSYDVNYNYEADLYEQNDEHNANMERREERTERSYDANHKENLYEQDDEHREENIDTPLT